MQTMKTANNTTGPGQQAKGNLSRYQLILIYTLPVIWALTTVIALGIAKVNSEKQMQIEFERGAMFTVHYHHKYDYYPSMGLRQHIYENPGLGWDSLTVKYEADAKKWYDQWRKAYVNKKPVFKLRPQ